MEVLEALAIPVICAVGYCWWALRDIRRMKREAMREMEMRAEAKAQKGRK